MLTKPSGVKHISPISTIFAVSVLKLVESANLVNVHSIPVW